MRRSGVTLELGHGDAPLPAPAQARPRCPALAAGMLKVGYYRQEEEARGRYDAALRSLGCQVIRSDAADGAGPPVLRAVLEFLGEGDQLVTPSLDHLGRSTQAVLELIEALDRRGASLMVVEPPMVSTGVAGHALRAALKAALALEANSQGETPGRRRARGVAEAIQRLHREGVPQIEIARRLDVSRMTVWRKLRADDP